MLDSVFENLKHRLKLSIYFKREIKLMAMDFKNKLLRSLQGLSEVFCVSPFKTHILKYEIKKILESKYHSNSHIEDRVHIVSINKSEKKMVK